MDKIEKLYIYEILGDVVSEKAHLGHHFLGCWNESGHSYLFFSARAKHELHRLLVKSPHLKLISKTEMDYDQWEPSDALKPFKIPPLSFIPVWSGKETDDPMQILLYTGVVFGAGTHGTTYKCLEFLISLMKEEPIDKVLDLGTGTGILALAAAKLGAKDIIAIDNNNLAVETALKNVEFNKLKDKIKCIHDDAVNYLETGADLTLANLILWELEKMFIPQKNYGSKWYIVSGLNRADVGTFKKQITDLPFEIIKHEMDNLWSTLLLRNNSISD